MGDSSSRLVADARCGSRLQSTHLRSSSWVDSDTRCCLRNSNDCRESRASGFSRVLGSPKTSRSQRLTQVGSAAVS